MLASEFKARKTGSGRSTRSPAGPSGSVPLPGTPVRGSRTGRPVMALLDLLGRRWALRVLWELRDGDAPTFRELRDAGIVSAAEGGGGGYQLTSDGHELLSVLAPVDEWAKRWGQRSTR